MKRLFVWMLLALVCLSACGKTDAATPATNETTDRPTSSSVPAPTPVAYDETVLQNTFYRLTTEKKLNVGYIGDSITYGRCASDYAATSYSALTTAWLREAFPEAAVQEINAGISGTGIQFAAYRAYADLRLDDPEKRPDLVFVEQALNTDQENTGSEDILLYTESLVQTIRAFSPEADIVFLFTTSYEQGETVYDAITQMSRVAAAYRIPCISIGSRLIAEIVAENGGVYPEIDSELYLHYFHDYCHPVDPGHARYAAYVTEFLSAELLDKKPDPALHGTSFMPAEAVCENKLVAPHHETFKGQTLPEGCLFRMGNDGSIATETENSKISFTFSGTDLLVWAYTEDDAGAVTVSIDGGPGRYQIFHQRYGGSYIYTLAENLEPGEHIVQIVTRKSRYGTKIDLHRFFITGDPLYTPIVLQAD